MFSVANRDKGRAKCPREEHHRRPNRCPLAKGGTEVSGGTERPAVQKLPNSMSSFPIHCWRPLDLRGGWGWTPRVFRECTDIKQGWLSVYSRDIRVCHDTKDSKDLGWSLCSFSSPNVTQFARLGGFNDRNLLSTVLGTRCPRPKLSAGSVPLSTLREGSVPGFSPRLTDGLVHLHMPPFHVCFQIPLFRRTPVILD